MHSTLPGLHSILKICGEHEYEYCIMLMVSNIFLVLHGNTQTYKVMSLRYDVFFVGRQEDVK